MQLRGLEIPSVRGIRIVVDYSWLIIFFLVIYTMGENYSPNVQRHVGAAERWTMAVLTAALLFVSVLLHELAHAVVAQRFGIRVQSIRLFIFGGVPQASAEPSAGRHEFLIALAGPATSMTLAFAFGAAAAVLYFAGGKSSPGVGVAQYLAGANLVLAVFNLIPGFPLDGGRILRAFLWDRWNDLARATRVVSQIGNSFALLLIILGVVQFFVTQNVLSGLWLVLIGLFMKQSALGSYRAMAVKQALSGVPVRRIMNESVVSVDWLTPIDQLVRDFVYGRRLTHFPVSNRDDILGMVSLDAVRGIPKDLWGFKQVRDIMTPLEELPSLRPSDDAADALARMLQTDSSPMLVMDEGRMVGIISRHDILHFLKIKSDLGLA